MSGVVLKADQEHGLYCIWSSVVDQPTVIGDRINLLAHLTDHDIFDSNGRCCAVSDETAEAMMVRADTRGTSAPSMIRIGEWTTTSPLMVESIGFMHRDRLYAFLTALNASDWLDTGVIPPDAVALVESFEA